MQKAWIALVLAALFIAPAVAADGPKERIFFNRLTNGNSDVSRMGLFLADADGQNERPLLPATSLDYNASFSADGKWIVFTSERADSADVYRVHPDGTGLERLTESPSFDDQATLSPNGLTLAFISTREGGTANIWLLDLATHRTRNLTKNKSGNFRPSWSPDGKWIAFTSDRDTHPGRNEPSWELLQLTALYIVHPDGTGLRRLTPLDQFAGSPKWSPDGRLIVYYQAPGDVWMLQIASVDIATGVQQMRTTGDERKLSPQYLNDNEIGYLTWSNGKRQLAYTSGRVGLPSELENPSWSPDGRAVVYQKPIHERSRMGSTYSFDPKFDLHLTGNFPAFSPVGDQLVIAGGPGAGQNELVLMNADGSNPRDLFDAGKGNVLVSPTWSPDGKFIAFAMGGFFRRPVQPGQLAIIRSDGSDLRVLTKEETSSGFPSFSPDGKRLVYRVLGNGEQGLRIISLDDGTVTKLTTDRDSFPAWSPRGDRIVFTGFKTGDFEIYAIRPDGADLRQLTSDHGNDAHPIWSPDGRSIIFTSSRTGWKDENLLPGHGGQAYGKIFVMREDGTDVRQLTDNPWEEGTAAWLPPAHPQKSASAHSP